MPKPNGFNINAHKTQNILSNKKKKFEKLFEDDQIFRDKEHPIVGISTWWCTSVHVTVLTEIVCSQRPKFRFHTF